MFIDSIPAIYSKILIKDTNFANYLLILDAYSKILKLYGTENITTEEFMDELDMFQARFDKVDQFIWCDMDIITTESVMQVISKYFK